MKQEINQVYVGDCRDFLPYGVDLIYNLGLKPVVVTDPPFNIGYHYEGYSDDMTES